MAAVTAPGARRSLIGMVLGAVQSRARAKGRTSRVVAAAQEHMMTFAALAAGDFAFFHLGRFAGWLAVAGSLLLADYQIRG